MIVVMLGSATLTFLMLGLARSMPDPYWRILLHAQEATLAVFVFCSVALFLRTFEVVPQLTWRGRSLVRRGTPAGHWKPMIALLMGVVALAYRVTALKAFVAWNNVSADDFHTWSHQGNVFSLTFALIAGTIALAHLADPHPIRRVLAYVAAIASLVSLLPLLDPLGVPPTHPLSFGFVLAVAALLYAVARLIRVRWGVL